jgi:hypothetical protein
MLDAGAPACRLKATTPSIFGMGWPLASDFQTMVTRAPGLSNGSRASPAGSNCQVFVSPSTSTKVIVPALMSTETTWACV